MITYQGKREGCVTVVTVNGIPLNPRLDLWNHSPTGFEWGYGGSGPAQLALALLAHHLGDDNAAVALHQDFKHAVITLLDQRGWTLTGEEIGAAIVSLRAQTGKRPVLRSEVRNREGAHRAQSTWDKNKKGKEL